MNPQVNWQKLKSELNKVTDVNKLKADLQKIAAEIRGFDFHTVLTPQAAEKVKTFEKKYAELIKTVHQAQRQVDREVNKIIRTVKGHHFVTDVRLENIRKVALDQKDKLTKATIDLRKRFSKETAPTPPPAKKKRSASRKPKSS